MTVYAERLAITPVTNLEKPGVRGVLETAHIYDTESGEMLAIDTYGVDGRTSDSKRLVAVFQPWSDYVGREFARQRMDLISETMDAKVVGIDNLGVGVNTSDVPGYLRRDIAGGDFSRVSQMQWEALRQNRLYDQSDELTLAYYSLGASMAASMAAQTPEGTTVDRMVLWECAGIESGSMARLALTYFVDGPKNWKNYIAENPDWVAEPSGFMSLARQISRQPAGHIVYPAGMVHKTVEDDLSLAYEKGALKRDSHVHIINGTKSRVSPVAANDRLAERVNTFPLDRVDRTTYVGETHSVNDSFPRIAHALGRIARQPMAS